MFSDDADLLELGERCLAFDEGLVSLEVLDRVVEACAEVLPRVAEELLPYCGGGQPSLTRFWHSKERKIESKIAYASV